MAIRQVIFFQTRPGTGQEFTKGFAPIIANVRREQGCEEYELFQSGDDPDRFVMLERWTDQAALDSALKRLYPGKDHPSVAFFQLVQGPPRKERYEID
jgi:quinol monooxygenase YgiN